MTCYFPRRLFYGLLLVLLWLGYVVEGSHALFASAAGLTGTTLTTGTTSLLISNSQNGTSSLFSQSRPGFALSLSPGQHDDHYIILKNASPSNVDLDISAATALSNPIDNGLAALTTISFTPVDSSGTPTGAAQMGALDQFTQNLSLNTTIPQGASQRFLMRTALDSSYSQQGQTISYDLNFSGVQHYVP